MIKIVNFLRKLKSMYYIYQYNKKKNSIKIGSLVEYKIQYQVGSIKKKGIVKKIVGDMVKVQSSQLRHSYLSKWIYISDLKVLKS